MSTQPLADSDQRLLENVINEADRFIAGVDSGDPVFRYPQAPKECLLECLDVIDENLVVFRHQPGVGWKLIELEILKGKVEKRDL